MLNIKNLIYLDNYKMCSFSSQIFQGKVEYSINKEHEEQSDTENQKGPLFSGKDLGDYSRYGTETLQKKLLHDYEYSIFENYLEDTGALLTIDSQSDELEIKQFTQNKFLKITGRATINDLEKVVKTFKNFNKLGENITILTMADEIIGLDEQLSKVDDQGLSDVRKAIKKVEKDCNIQRMAEKAGLHRNGKFLNCLAEILEFSFQNKLEIQLEAANLAFTADLKREMLREPIENIIRKYSRKTEIEFTIVGLITQATAPLEDIAVPVIDSEHLGTIVRNFTHHIRNIENTFSSRMSNEIFIDPIAVYTTIGISEDK